MTTWTDAARRELDAVLARQRQALVGAEGDPQEVIDDLRRHVEEEVAVRQLRVVSEDDVRAILATVGDAAPASVRPTTTAARERSVEAPATRTVAGQHQALAKWHIVWLWTLGVLLPAATLGIELATRMCTKGIFNPMPSLLHPPLVAMVPLANLGALLAIQRGATALWWRRLAFANGLALGISFYYTLVFLPLMPIGALAIIAYGLGLLPLAPALALAAGFGLRLQLRRRMPAALRGRRQSWSGAWGFAVAMVVLLGLGLPRAFTLFTLQQAVTGEPTESARAVGRLRLLGSDDVLLRACYERTGELGDLWSQLRSDEVPPAKAREVYYRVTGQPFNSVPPPKLSSLRGRPVNNSWDDDQGGAAVGGVLKGVSLASSRLDGSLHPTAALGYLEWTLEFRNDAAVAREARAVLALPPGGAVSRATLWIDGEEREAAFGSRAAVRAAYENLVRIQRNRDPLLVTTAGPDRVLVQCFPVPAGGLMKIRIGITAPLPLEATDRARLYLPHFVERNFHISTALEHGVWLESEERLDDSAAGDSDRTPASLVREHTPAAASALRGGLSDVELGAKSILIQRNSQALAAWARDHTDAAFEVVQGFEPAPPQAPESVVLVVDGSKGLATEVGAIRAMLIETLSGPRPLVVVAGDEIAEVPFESLVPPLFRGGADNLPALVHAWDRAATSAGGLVIWVHGPQPVELSSVEELRQRCERRPEGPRIVSLAVAPGPNFVLGQLDGCPLFEMASRRSTLAVDLQELLAGRRADGAVWMPRRSRVVAQPQPTGTESSDHLVRLWARDEAHRLAVTADGLAAATVLAVRYRIVTPQSGAVVLETQRQFEDAGLVPGTPEQVPTIPEPAAILLATVVAALVCLAVFWRRPWCADRPF